jgi:HAD superfamily hydrolase (TIGR01509 family)
VIRFERDPGGRSSGAITLRDIEGKTGRCFAVGATGRPVVIFDCNGVLVDSEPIASAVLADALSRVGVPLTADVVAQRFHGRRAADIFAAVEKSIRRSLPPAFPANVAAETLRRLRAELRPVAHAVRALTWIRGPKAVASSSSLDRIRLSLEVTDLLRFVEPRLFSASEVANGKPSPDLFLLAARRLNVNPQDCIVVEDSAAGVAAATAAGMQPIGFVGGSSAEGHLARDLIAAGARIVIADLRALQSAIIDLRGW